MSNEEEIDYGKQVDQYDWIEYVNYPQSKSLESQEPFVLNVLKHKKNGYYVEVGANHPFIANNTSILEKEFGWTGVGIEIEPHYVEEYNKSRKNECVLADALTFDYKDYFEKNNFPKQIDYLQIDVDDNPRHANLMALLQLPLSEYRFSVITFEHEAGRDYTLDEMRKAQRLILSSYGYKLVVQGIDEDWWVDPRAVPGENYWSMYTVGKFMY